MLKIYGSMLCGDCVECTDAFDKAGIQYTFLDFAQDLKNLKEFLAIRDRLDLFAMARTEGYIGIPCILQEDGNVSLDWQTFL